MLETIVIISNGIVVIAIGALYARINNHGKELSKHIVYTVKEITGRPDFKEVDKKIEKVEKQICTKLKPIKEDLHEVREKFFEHLLETK